MRCTSDADRVWHFVPECRDILFMSTDRAAARKSDKGSMISGSVMSSCEDSG